MCPVTEGAPFFPIPSFVTIGRSVRELLSENPRGVHHPLCRRELRNRELQFWTTVNFEVEYFINEETEDVLNDTVIYIFL